MRPVDGGAAAGGVRRFLPNPMAVFPAQTHALELARGVPKLGRLGSRLTSGLIEPRRHHGVDIYFRRPPQIIAPFGGSIEVETDRRDRDVGAIVLASPQGDEFMLMRPLYAPRRSGGEVGAGERIGSLASAPCFGCNMIPAIRDFPHLHLEYWSARELGYFAERALALPAGLRLDKGNALQSHNALYAMKLGLIGLPVSDADTELALDLPLRDPEIYPDVVDGLESEGGVPSRLMKTDAGDGRQEGTPWWMFAGSPSGRSMRSRSRSMSSLVRVLAG